MLARWISTARGLMRRASPIALLGTRFTNWTRMSISRGVSCATLALAAARIRSSLSVRCPSGQAAEGGIQKRGVVSSA
jgi:hypothetical protein